MYFFHISQIKSPSNFIGEAFVPKTGLPSAIQNVGLTQSPTPLSRPGIFICSLTRINSQRSQNWIVFGDPQMLVLPKAHAANAAGHFHLEVTRLESFVDFL